MLNCIRPSATELDAVATFEPIVGCVAANVGACCVVPANMANSCVRLAVNPLSSTSSVPLRTLLYSKSFLAISSSDLVPFAVSWLSAAGPKL